MKAKTVPSLFICDLSWPIIKTELKVFNNETILQYIDRCFSIVPGNARHTKYLRILPSSLSSLKQTINHVSNTKSTRPVGFINKGNTCYANSILQVLIVVPNLWNRVPSESNTLSPMLRAISLNMAVKKNSTKPVDPSNFFMDLKT